jgi:hypothetical protein
VSATPASGPVRGERLLELSRMRSFVTVDLVEFADGHLGISIGYTPISPRNPRSMTRFVTLAPEELPRVVAALEAGRVRIEQERGTGAAT